MQYICLVGSRLPPPDGYVSVCLVLTIQVYDKTHIDVGLVVLVTLSLVPAVSPANVLSVVNNFDVGGAAVLG